MIIDKITNYIRTCPHLDIFNNAIRLNVDYLDSNTDTYSIEEIQGEPILKKYINGDSICQYDFIFTSRESFGDEVFKNIDNSGFYEKFVEWIEDQNHNKVFPNLENGLAPLEIKVTSTGYAFPVTNNTAKFQIQLRLKYFKKK
ncbi:chloramphenicol resistance protein [Hathewaya histolytica]|uniref:Chloramphenicol resistance protein n=1 Tax=Hathewaya histolytica TaxID=1498 RepID=A0A4U9RP08_HATHI|nr:chloramphenicol resistance protein [Hathewaya histolytica]VTQ93769.1 Uncharacterised protein [Hathewaya histolytica]